MLNRTQALSERRTQLEDCGFMQVGESPSKDKIVIYLLKSKKNKKGLGVNMKDICSWPPIQFLPPPVKA